MIKKTFFSLLVLVVAVFSLSGCKSGNVADLDILETSKESNEIIWGVKNDTRLFGLMDIPSREVKGFDIDIAKAITDKILGRDGRATFVEVTSKTRIPLLKNGNIDAIIATMTISEERKKQVDFSDVYFDAGQSLLVKKGSSITGVDSLDETTTVLAVKGSTSAVNIQGDAMTTDNAILLGMSSENPDYELVGGTFTEEPYGIAINKGQENFLQAVNDALKEMHEDGTYDEIYEKWFPNDDTGKVK
jgi:putative glutamine transport system substrate-binding protein